MKHFKPVFNKDTEKPKKPKDKEGDVGTQDEGHPPPPPTGG
jgi:hypothetical protein